MRCYNPILSLFFTTTQAADKFPDVDNYRGRWPVVDLIKLRLKNMSSKYRKQTSYKIALGKPVAGDTSVKLKAKKVKHKQSKVHYTYTWLNSSADCLQNAK